MSSRPPFLVGYAKSKSRWCLPLPFHAFDGDCAGMGVSGRQRTSRTTAQRQQTPYVSLSIYMHVHICIYIYVYMYDVWYRSPIVSYMMYNRYYVLHCTCYVECNIWRVLYAMTCNASTAHTYVRQYLPASICFILCNCNMECIYIYNAASRSVILHWATIMLYPLVEPYSTR